MNQNKDNDSFSSIGESEHIPDSTLIPESEFQMSDVVSNVPSQEEIKVEKKVEKEVKAPTQKISQPEPVKGPRKAKSEDSSGAKSIVNPLTLVAGAVAVVLAAVVGSQFGGSKNQGPMIVQPPLEMVEKIDKHGESITQLQTELKVIDENVKTLSTQFGSVDQRLGAMETSQKEVLNYINSQIEKERQAAEAATLAKPAPVAAPAQAPVAQESAPVAAKPAVEKEQVKQPARKLTANEIAAAKEKAAINKQKRAENQAKAKSKKLKEDELFNGMKVLAVKDNLVWISDANGKTVNYSLGDTVPGLGKLTLVNEASDQVKIGSRTFGK